MKFSEVVTLRKASREKRPDGTFETSTEDRDVFFNRYRTGLEARLAGASEGLRRMATGQVRSADYRGEQYAVLGGAEMTVQDASDQGEYTVLTLAERLPNG